jgi:ribosomal protein L37AE/L43A
MPTLTQEDQIILSSTVPRGKPISKVPKIKLATLQYPQSFSGGRGVFIAAEYDLSEVGKVEDVDGFVRQAFKKKLGLMFKEGLDYSGANKRTIQYIKTRMAQIARATDIPSILLLKRVAHSLIRTSNAFLIKVRDPKASGGQERKTPEGKRLKPVAGYFPAAPESMQVDMDHETGKIHKYRQMMPNGRYKDFPVEDVIHFHIDRREGFLFGTPGLIPVYDDIRALRQIEENVELLLYQNLFPLFHFKVGTETAPAGYTEEGTREIDAIEDQIKLMPSEGALVTSERYEINAIGSEGRAIRAEGYLEHFKKRVFAGLGVSQIDMGDGDTTNRATAQTLSRALIDAVKDIQDSLEAQWDHFVISELLLESTFDDNVLDEENMVHLNFAEIDIQNKMEQEKHAADMFKGYALTHDELREELNREPVPIPDDPQDQDLSRFPEWSQTYWKLFEEPLNLIRAVDEPFSVPAQSASQARSLGATEQQLRTAQTAKEQEVKKAAEEDRKTKVAVAKARPKPTARKDHFLASSFRDLEIDSVARLKSSIINRGRVDFDYVGSLARLWASSVSDKLITLTTTQMLQGFNDQTGDLGSQAEIELNAGRDVLRNRVQFRIQKLVGSIMDLFVRRVDGLSPNVKLAEVQVDYIRQLHAVFDAVRYRIDFIWDVEVRKAYSFGRILGMRFLGDFAVESVPHADACERCHARSERIDLVEFLGIDDLVPHHPNCRCRIRIHRQGRDMVFSDEVSGSVPEREKGKEAIAQEEESLTQQTMVCPSCSRTAVLQPRSGRFYCRRCNESFEKKEEKDQAKLERCVLSVKQSLKKKNPSMGDKELKSRAFAICNSRIKKG